MKVTQTTVTLDGRDIPARLIEDGDLRITVRQRLYRDRLTLAALERKLLPSVNGKSPTPEQEDEQTARTNFAYFAAQSAIEGVGWQLPTRETPADEVEAAFQAFTFLPDTLVQAWLRQLNGLENSNEDPATKRPEFLTEDEAKDPLSAAPDVPNKPKSTTS
jgi:hypothetical protein